MTRLNWANVAHSFEAGLDRGVLYPKNGTAVPWLGLISVDEEGQSEAVSYYIDGRPYLIVPQPKEFSATLKAYTYPDEFSAAMGVEEAADGMYLDSQQADSFGLCYRTMIGSEEGANAGYKLHIVYNATAQAAGVSYATLSNGVDPSELSWSIQATPVPVPGYRATAHIIIDTRHMDDERIFQIEALLYGTPAADAHLPAPELILDILGFGDTIVITDNGDGTWTAEGSYQNILLLNDGVFQINNVNATTNTGAGTFTVSNTNV